MKGTATSGKTSCKSSASLKLGQGRVLSTEFVAYAASSLGKPPFNIEMRAPYAARAALQTPFIGYNNPVFFEPVDVGRTEI